MSDKIESVARELKRTNLQEGYIFNINKPYGWSSTDVVRKLKGMLGSVGYRKIKVGHAGTLDPLATGVLLVCVGRATKRVDELQAEQKEYVTEIRLGATTPSFDLEHQVDQEYPYEHITRESLEQALAKLSGERLQTPPTYSAKRVDGKRAYDLARGGERVELRQAMINIYSMELLEFNLPIIKICVKCSKGTYIRSIAWELGEALDSGGHLISLERVSSGDYHSKEGFKVEDLEHIFHRMKQN